MKKIITRSSAETEKVGIELASSLKKHDVIAMFGTMGMGKTAFVRGLATGLGIDAEVSSPTYALVHEYIGSKLSLYHFDMYRVNTWDDLDSTGFFHYLDLGGVLAVEWSENIEQALPEKYIKVNFEIGSNENERIITILNIGDE